MNSQTFAKVLIAALIAFAPASTMAQEPPSEDATEQAATTEDDSADDEADESTEAQDADSDDESEDAAATSADGEQASEPGTAGDEEQTQDTSGEQTDGEQTDEEETGEAADAEGQEASGDEQAPEPQAVEQPSEEAPDVGEPLQRESVQPEPTDDDPEDSPIADLAEESDEEGFQPLEDVEEGMLESITPARVFPFVELSGDFRLRSDAKLNFDLDTEGTSAVPPPAQSYQPNPPADEDADAHWTTDMRFRLAPTIHITEGLRLHVETDLLDNVVLGTQRPAGTPSMIGFANGSDDPTFIKINEAWGEAEILFLRLRAGRMDDDWGLGIFANDGDCMECDYEAPIDRVALSSKVWKLYARLTVDFPQEGLVDRRVMVPGGQPFDAGQADDIRQWTVSVFRTPMSREDRELQNQALRGEQRPVFNGGLYFKYRTRQGARTSTDDQLYYKGLRVFAPDLWFQMLYNPDEETYVRLELEGVALLGSVDNDSNAPVGNATDDPDLDENINCFDENVRNANRAECTSTADGENVSRDIAQFGAALESEIYLGGPVRFGFDTGAASGGDSPSWGLDLRDNPAVSNSQGFYRFNPNYMPDLILFREVIGTVTNAAYFKPWLQARFLESPDRRMELQFDAIASTALNKRGTPARDSNMLGVELDTSVRFLQIERFTAELEGGILFPFDGLASVASTSELERLRVNDYADQGPVIDTSIDPKLAWTVQGNFFWKF
ncbi:MAG: hypothetical protein ACQEVA_07425 [Myxococcota bacterium]